MIGVLWSRVSALVRWSVPGGKGGCTLRTELFGAGCCGSAAHVFLTKQPDEEEPGAAGGWVPPNRCAWVPPNRCELIAVTLVVCFTTASCLGCQLPVFIRFLVFADGFSAAVTAGDSIVSRKSKS